MALGLSDTCPKIGGGFSYILCSYGIGTLLEMTPGKICYSAQLENPQNHFVVSLRTTMYSVRLNDQFHEKTKYKDEK